MTPHHSCHVRSSIIVPNATSIRAALRASMMHQIENVQSDSEEDQEDFPLIQRNVQAENPSVQFLQSDEVLHELTCLAPGLLQRNANVSYGVLHSMNYFKKLLLRDLKDLRRLEPLDFDILLFDPVKKFFIKLFHVEHLPRKASIRIVRSTKSRWRKLRQFVCESKTENSCEQKLDLGVAIEATNWCQGELYFSHDKTPDPFTTYFPKPKTDRKVIACGVPAYNEEASDLRRTLSSLNECMNYKLKEYDFAPDPLPKGESHNGYHFSCLLLFDGLEHMSESNQEFMEELFGIDMQLLEESPAHRKAVTFIAERPQSIQKNVKFPNLHLYLLIKRDNRKKHNSHEWFLSSFCRQTEATFAFCTDCGTLFDKKCLTNLVKYLENNRDVSACCGRQRVMTAKDQGCDDEGVFESFLRKVQCYDFEACHAVDKPAFSLIGFMPVLPGPCGLFRYSEIESQVIDNYFEMTHADPTDLGIIGANLTIAEDRILSSEAALSSTSGNSKTKWCCEEGDAIFYFEAETELETFVKQRRRWINGTAAGYLWWLSQGQIWGSGHTFLYKLSCFILNIFEVLKYIIVLLTPAIFAIGLRFGLKDIIFGIDVSADLNATESSTTVLDVTNQSDADIFVWGYMALYIYFVYHHAQKQNSYSKWLFIVVLLCNVLVILLAFTSMFKFLYKSLTNWHLHYSVQLDTNGKTVDFVDVFRNSTGPNPDSDSLSKYYFGNDNNDGVTFHVNQHTWVNIETALPVWSKDANVDNDEIPTNISSEALNSAFRTSVLTIMQSASYGVGFGGLGKASGATLSDGNKLNVQAPHQCISSPDFDSQTNYTCQNISVTPNESVNRIWTVGHCDDSTKVESECFGLWDHDGDGGDGKTAPVSRSWKNNSCNDPSILVQNLCIGKFDHDGDAGLGGTKPQMRKWHPASCSDVTIKNQLLCTGNVCTDQVGCNYDAMNQKCINTPVKCEDIVHHVVPSLFDLACQRQNGCILNVGTIQITALVPSVDAFAELPSQTVAELLRGSADMNTNNDFYNYAPLCQIASWVRLNNAKATIFAPQLQCKQPTKYSKFLFGHISATFSESILQEPSSFFHKSLEEKLAFEDTIKFYQFWKGEWWIPSWSKHSTIYTIEGSKVNLLAENVLEWEQRDAILTLGSIGFILFPLINTLLSLNLYGFWLMITSFVPYYLFLPTLIGWFGAYSLARSHDLKWGNRPSTAPDVKSIVGTSQSASIIIVILNILLVYITIYNAPGQEADQQESRLFVDLTAITVSVFSIVEMFLSFFYFIYLAILKILKTMFCCYLKKDGKRLVASCEKFV
eukprot:g3302.t1